MSFTLTFSLLILQTCKHVGIWQAEIKILTGNNSDNTTKLNYPAFSLIVKPIVKMLNYSDHKKEKTNLAQIMTARQLGTEREIHRGIEIRSNKLHSYN